MTITRRKVLMVGGATAVLSAAGGWTALTTPSLSKASAPWLLAGGDFDDLRLAVLAYAILAPNPHNRQPWQFALKERDRIEVTCDLNRRLPSTDPFDRQITIGFGCMIELLRQAAAELDHHAEIAVFPDGEQSPRLSGGRIADIRLVPGSPSHDPLFGSILARRSTKEPFLDRPVPPAAVASLGAMAPDGVAFGYSRSQAEREALAANAWQAWQIEQETPATRRESIDVMRFGNAAIVANPDGIDMGGPLLSAAHTAGIVTPATLDTPGSMAFQSGVNMYRAMADATPRWVWLITHGNTRREQLAAGAAWVRLNLAATERGLAVHPWSHALQEFPEMDRSYRELRELIAPAGETVQMFARLGYGPDVPQSPRWPLEAKLVDG